MKKYGKNNKKERVKKIMKLWSVWCGLWKEK